MNIKKPKLLIFLVTLVISILALTTWMHSDRLEKEDLNLRTLVKETLNSNMSENLKK